MLVQTDDVRLRELQCSGDIVIGLGQHVDVTACALRQPGCPCGLEFIIVKALCGLSLPIWSARIKETALSDARFVTEALNKLAGQGDNLILKALKG